jgi:hypothetical protein
MSARVARDVEGTARLAGEAGRLGIAGAAKDIVEPARPENRATVLP